MWIAKLKIIDNVENIHTILDYKFTRIMKYIDLYRDLSYIFRYLGFENCKYKMKQITFTFTYLDKNIIVDDWNKYILNKDQIEIKIDKLDHIYRLVDSYSGRTIIESKNLKILYSHYNKNLKSKLSDAVLVKCDNTLIDVLDDYKYHLNACINRLIHRYY